MIRKTPLKMIACSAVNRISLAIMPLRSMLEKKLLLRTANRFSGSMEMTSRLPKSEPWTSSSFGETKTTVRTPTPASPLCGLYLRKNWAINKAPLCARLYDVSRPAGLLPTDAWDQETWPLLMLYTILYFQNWNWLLLLSTADWSSPESPETPWSRWARNGASSKSPSEK